MAIQKSYLPSPNVVVRLLRSKKKSVCVSFSYASSLTSYSNAIDKDIQAKQTSERERKLLQQLKSLKKQLNTMNKDQTAGAARSRHDDDDMDDLPPESEDDYSDGDGNILNGGL